MIFGLWQTLITFFFLQSSFFVIIEVLHMLLNQKAHYWCQAWNVSSLGLFLDHRDKTHLSVSNVSQPTGRFTLHSQKQHEHNPWPTYTETGLCGLTAASADMPWGRSQSQQLNQRQKDHKYRAYPLTTTVNEAGALYKSLWTGQVCYRYILQPHQH